MKKNLFFVMLSTFLVVLLLGWVSLKTYLYIEKLSLDRFNHQQTLLIRQSVLGFESFTEDIIKNLELLATFTSVRENRTGEILNDLSSFYARQSPDLVDIARTDTSGSVIMIYPDIRNNAGQDINRKENIKNVVETRRTSVSSFFKTSEGYYAYAIHTPVFNKVLVGTVGVLVSQPRIRKLFIEMSVSGPAATALLFDGTGKILSASNTALEGKNLSECSPGIRVIERIKGISFTRNPVEKIIRIKPSSKRYLVSMMPVNIKNKTWYMAVVIPASNVLYTVSPWMRRMLFWIYAIVFLMVASHLILGRVMLTTHKREIIASEKITAAAEKEKLQNEIEKRENFLTNLFQSSSDSVFSLGRDVKFNFINPQTAELTGLPEEKLLTMSFYEIFPADEKERIEDFVMRSFNGERVTLKETEILDKNQNRRACLISLAPMNLPDKNKNLMGILTDITEIKILRSKLSQSEKMLSLGIMAGGLAHEINNPLSSLLGFAKMARKKIQDSPQESETIDRYLDKITDSAHLIKEIVENLNEYATQPDSTIQPLNLNRVVNHVLSLVQEEMENSSIALHKNLSDEDLMIEGDMSQLAQIILNLLTNARQAQKSGGEIRVSTYRNTRDAGEQEAILEISDKGVGISKENIEHIFDPFFTTKRVWQNTGLGLSISYNIIKKMGGNITVESEQGHGSAFRVHLKIL